MLVLREECCIAKQSCESSTSPKDPPSLLINFIEWPGVFEATFPDFIDCSLCACFVRTVWIASHRQNCSTPDARLMLLGKAPFATTGFPQPTTVTTQARCPNLTTSMMSQVAPVNFELAVSIRVYQLMRYRVLHVPLAEDAILTQQDDTMLRIKASCTRFIARPAKKDAH